MNAATQTFVDEIRSFQVRYEDVVDAANTYLKTEYKKPGTRSAEDTTLRLRIARLLEENGNE